MRSALAPGGFEVFRGSAVVGCQILDRALFGKGDQVRCGQDMAVRRFDQVVVADVL
ncbi:hypothetical protein [Puniceibacterium sp. IMCC21224]|uniref:hypothetical protein n=1 Tax=Puniceibacterium sp. IMCC21224 TaxID=1618204 RepID=UPI00065D04CE|nr:hypothetical protein [Puniceibacterium sp. IMCC21224]KMK65256.1 hypothetical protein IMCC21224_1187 [Puniceibacterium sp. IMCC21224]